MSAKRLIVRWRKEIRWVMWRLWEKPRTLEDVRAVVVLGFASFVACARPVDAGGSGSTSEEGDASTGAPSSEGTSASASSTTSSDGSTSETSSEGSSGACEIIGPDFAVLPSSMLDGTWLVPTEPGLRAELPAEWIAWHARHSNNLHLSRDELELVREGSGEWDTEYAEVLALLLDFNQCAAHVGGSGWGADGGGFGDLQLRVYRVSETPDEIVARAMAQAWDTIEPEIIVDDSGPWTGLRISYYLSYGDYGGHANVELRMHRFGDTTAVLAGMFVDTFPGAEQFAAIVATACWDSLAGECCGV